MRKLAISLVFVVSNMAFAAILNSELELRHQSLIEQQVAEQCRYVGVLTQTSVEKIETVEDQKPLYLYTIQLMTQVRTEQMMFEERFVTVKSVMSSAYDHNAKDWGIYDVTEINCH